MLHYTKVLRGSKVFADLREYIDSYDKEQGRARTLMTKCWQSMQSVETKNLNFDKDLEDIQSTARKVGWSEEEKTARPWKSAGRRRSVKRRSPEFQPKMEGVYLVAEWTSLKEMKALQSVCTVPPETHSELTHRAQKIEFESCK